MLNKEQANSPEVLKTWYIKFFHKPEVEKEPEQKPKAKGLKELLFNKLSQK